MNGLDGQMTTARSRRSASADSKSGCAAACSRSGESERPHHRTALPPNEIVLKIEPALVGSHAGPHGIVAHRQQARPDSEPAAEIGL